MKEILWNFKQNPWKIPKKSFIFSKIEGPKNEFISEVFVKSLSNFVHDFWEDSFRKPKLL